MQTAESVKPVSDEMRAKMEQYRIQLLDAGMLEPTKIESSNWHWLFYKPATALTAFVVNLHGSDCCIEVTYGYASTAFTRMAGDKNVLIEWGVSDEDITIREKIVIRGKADEEIAGCRIGEMYSRYLTTEKDDLLTCAKAKRKEFIQQIAAKLKPLGFKKRSNTWTRALELEYYLMCNVQKSDFSDEYYFNVYIGKNGTIDYGDCYYTRVFPDGMCPMDWQALSQKEFDFFLEHTVVPALQQIINTPLIELGKLPSIWSCCYCDRHKCERCWVEKNLREGKIN